MNLEDLVGNPMRDNKDSKLKPIRNVNTDTSLDDLLGEELDEIGVDSLDSGFGKVDAVDADNVIESNKSLWIKLGGKGLSKKMVLMGTPVEEVVVFQQRRVVRALTIAVTTGVLAIILKNLTVAILAIIGALLFLFVDYLVVNNKYTNFQFLRQLDFNKFIRQLMPYLRGKEVVVYKAFEKMKDRLDDGTTRTALITLIAKMNSSPNSRSPYEEFANNSSGLDDSVLIMQTIYDYQRSSNDSTTINELAQLVDREMEKSIDEIIAKKDDRFEIDSYLLISCFMVPAFGYFIAVVMNLSSLFMV